VALSSRDMGGASRHMRTHTDRAPSTSDEAFFPKAVCTLRLSTRRFAIDRNTLALRAAVHNPIQRLTRRGFECRGEAILEGGMSIRVLGHIEIDRKQAPRRIAADVESQVASIYNCSRVNCAAGRGLGFCWQVFARKKGRQLISIDGPDGGFLRGLGIYLVASNAFEG